jgi:hypothetical protein
MGHLSCFQSLDMVNSATINMGAQVALSSPGVNSFRYALKSGISSSTYTFVRDLHKFYGFYEPLTSPVLTIYVHTLPLGEMCL